MDCTKCISWDTNQEPKFKCTHKIMGKMAADPDCAVTLCKFVEPKEGVEMAAHGPKPKKKKEKKRKVK